MNGATAFRKSGSLFLMVCFVGVLPETSAIAQSQSCPQFSPDGVMPELDNPKLTPRTTLLCNDGFASLNSGLVHQPLWSAEYLTASAVSSASSIGRTTNRFHADGRLPAGDGAVLSDYRRSGFDRGHMVPSGDAATIQAQEQTFTLANVVPQTAALNEGIWTGVEMAVRHLAQRDGAVYVVTGPAFHDSTRGIGHDVLVPSSTWKAVYDPTSAGAGVYVCKNNDTPTCTIVSVAALIHAVGIDPFPSLPADMKARAMDLPEPESSPYRARQSQSYQNRLERQGIRLGLHALKQIMED